MRTTSYTAILGLLAAALLAGCGADRDLPEEVEASPPLPPSDLDDSDAAFLKRAAGLPISWQRWGPEAFALAKELNRPIFLYVGYSASAWCRKFEHASLEHPAVAGLLNSDFVPVVVDAYEHPEVSDSLMRYLVATGKPGGWPLLAWLTPDRIPLSASGLLAPPGTRDQMTVDSVLTHIAGQWKQFPEHYADQADRDYSAFLAQTLPTDSGAAWNPSDDLAHRTFGAIAAGFDPVNPGLSGSPKFPHESRLEFLLWLTTSDTVSESQQERAGAMLVEILDAMAESAIYDHLDSGFFRYSSTSSWNAPTFEKLLATQARLARVYALAGSRFGNDHYSEVSKDLFQFIETSLALPGGGFGAGIVVDDSPHLWSADEINALLPEADRQLFILASTIQERGNLPAGAIYATPSSSGNVIHLAGQDAAAERLKISPEDADASIARSLAILRETRAADGSMKSDPTFLLASNAELVSAYAAAGETEKATALADLLLTTFYREDKEASPLLRVAVDGEARHPATARDYTLLVAALLDVSAAAPSASDRFMAIASALHDHATKSFYDSDTNQLHASTDRGRPLLPELADDSHGRSTPATMISNERRIALAAGRESGDILRLPGRYLGRQDARLARSAALVQAMLGTPGE